jgi:23S rRNA (cytosine1962-C5)-methyltransferase
MAKLILRKNEDRRIRRGHLWVFSNEVALIEGDASSGDIVEVCDNRRNLIGHGFYNKDSLISVRLLGSDYSGSFDDYACRALRHSYQLRKTLYPSRESFRMVFSESDHLPGLIIDKYNNTFVLQVYSYGMGKNIELIVDILKNEYGAMNVFTRNDEHFRALEGLGAKDEIYFGKVAWEIIDDGKIKYRIDFASSQKTGFYFDQCDNREFIERFVNGNTVLDAFCNSGGFGLHAAFAGAAAVTFLDSSEIELSNARYNFSMNNFSIEKEFIKKDAFDYLEECLNKNKKFDVLMLDPPSFAKSKKHISSAIKGYIKLNKLALQVLNENGCLVTSSCSHHVKQDDFLEAISNAAVRAKRNIQLIYSGGAALDHPRLPAMEETSYLKFAVFKVW